MFTTAGRTDVSSGNFPCICAKVLYNRKLAYPIQKKSEGYYVVIEFKAEPTLPKELDRRLKISDNVMRHLIINKDEK